MSLWVALLMATWAATVSFAGGQMRRADLIESGERAIYATLAMVVLASIGLWTALLTHDFSIKYVASFTSANLPKIYTITAFDVVVEGRLGRNGTFRATTLLAKCASRYENAPEKYRDTPGYKQGQQRA